MHLDRVSKIIMSHQHIQFGDIWLTPTQKGLREDEVLIDFDPMKYGRRRRILVDEASKACGSDETEINKFWLNKIKNNRIKKSYS